MKQWWWQVGEEGEGCGGNGVDIDELSL